MSDLDIVILIVILIFQLVLVTLMYRVNDTIGHILEGQIHIRYETVHCLKYLEKLTEDRKIERSE